MAGHHAVPMHHNDDAMSDDSSPSTAPPARRPSSLFDTQDTPFLENGVSNNPRAKRQSWWYGMVVRARRKVGIDGWRNGLEDETLLHDSFASGRTRWKRSGFSYCVFGGVVSGLTILAILLLIDLGLGFATFLWSSDIDSVLQNWGKPGTGTEGLAWYPTDFLRDITPIPCHSHNDYWRRVPLFDALHAGCTGIEADVWLFDEELYVGHNTASLTRNRTFTSLYIEPLVKILQQQNPSTDFYNGTSHGVFDTDPGKSLILLVDLKTGGAETWPWVLKQLQPLRERDWLSYVEDTKLHIGPITVVGTGNTPFHVLAHNATYRDAFFDAPLDAMWETHQTNQETKDWSESDNAVPDEWPGEDEGSAEENLPPSKLTPPEDVGQGMSGVLPSDEFNELNSYYASASFAETVGRVWHGRLSAGQLELIRGQVRGAHRRGLKARYWDLPSWPLGLRNHVWDILIDEGVDMLNVDDIRAASKQVW